MAIAFDNSEKATGSGDLTFSHVTAAGEDRYMVVGVISDRTISSITYNGDSFTEIRTLQVAGGESLYLYGLVAPDVGTADVVVTFGAGASERVAFSLTFTGVSQTTPIGAEVDEEVTSSILDTDITLLYTNSWAVELEETTQPSGSFTQNSSQDEREAFSGTTDYSGAIATKAFTTAGTENLGYISNINTQQAQMIIELVNADLTRSNNLMFY